jgi:hypothetical protein
LTSPARGGQAPPEAGRLRQRRAGSQPLSKREGQENVRYFAFNSSKGRARKSSIVTFNFSKEGQENVRHFAFNSINAISETRPGKGLYVF